MGAGPQSLTIRMYNVGFGECFLLTFKYAQRSRHVLVDYGSTSAPRRAGKDYMTVIANDIKRSCSGKLDIVVATHRHRDHVSGFSTDAGTGQIIAALRPDCVIQPWTEDPNAKTSALAAVATLYNRGKAAARQRNAHFLGLLEDMHGIAAAVAAAADGVGHGKSRAHSQLKFIGKDNIKNPSAVKNLMQMAKRGKSYYVNAGMKLRLLPGVKCTVLGPPTLRQSDAIRKERAKDPQEFWQFRAFWAFQNLALTRTFAVARKRIASRTAGAPPSVRWFLRQARQIHADQMLGLVRDLDSVMNNTSVILLLEVGKRKILLPGDAQIENWAYALSKPAWRKALANVNLYKVGHHGSLNATPRSLWALFRNKGTDGRRGRLATLCSTKAGKHGSAKSGTEVPRRLLVAELKKESDFASTEESNEPLCHITTLAF